MPVEGIQPYGLSLQQGCIASLQRKDTRKGYYVVSLLFKEGIQGKGNPFDGRDTTQRFIIKRRDKNMLHACFFLSLLRIFPLSLPLKGYELIIFSRMYPLPLFCFVFACNIINKNILIVYVFFIKRTEKIVSKKYYIACVSFLCVSRILKEKMPYLKRKDPVS